jgi:hypothetical protein
LQATDRPAQPAPGDNSVYRFGAPPRSTQAVGNPSHLPEYRVRVRDDLRQRIFDSAKQRGVSLSRELADRVERSFDQDPIVELRRDIKKLVKLHGA